MQDAGALEDPETERHDGPVPVLLVHNRYQHHGGEDVVFEAEAALLEARGHRVERLEVDNRSIGDASSLRQRLDLAAGTIWSRAASRRVAERVRATGAAVVHVHNFFPLLSPSIYEAARLEGAAIVQTLHNYRLICPAATLFRDGATCEDCVGRRVPWPGIAHACYRDSRAQSAVVGAMLTANNLRGTWRRDVDVFIALTEFARDRFIAGGLPAERISVKPNFIESTVADRTDPGSGFLFAGRLTPEKGVRVLLDAARRLPDGITIRVAGDGPLSDEVRGAAASNPGIMPLGFVSHVAIAAEMARARALIFPSQWYEPFGMSALEAFASGLPVIASRLGGIVGLVEDGVAGLLFPPGDPEALAGRMQWAHDHPVEMRAMGRQAREIAATTYGQDQNYAVLEDIYRVAIGRRSAALKAATEARLPRG